MVSHILIRVESIGSTVVVITLKDVYAILLNKSILWDL